MNDLKVRAVRGGFAKVCAQGLTFVLRMGALMILARLLEPRDFGLIGMVTAITGVLNLFRDFGLSTAAVQREIVTEEQFSTLFWINIVVGTALMLLSAGAAPFIAGFYHEPRLLPLTAVLSVGFLFNAAGVQHAAILQRQMRFTALAATDVISLVAGTGLGIAMALYGMQYWALAVMTIANPLVYTICVWQAAKWTPKAPKRRSGIRSMMHFGGTITLNSIVVYIGYNLEKVLLGRFWGASTIGVYGRAYQLVNIPTDNLNSAVGGVAFSALSRVQSDRERLKSYFLKGYSFVLALTLPATVMCAIFAGDLVRVLLGPKWIEAIPLFRYLAPTILVFSMINPFSWLLLSLGLVARSLKIALVIAPLMIVADLVGISFGPAGVAIAYSTALCLWTIPHIIWCVHGTNISLRDIFMAIARPFASGIVATAAGIGVVLLYGKSMAPLPRLLIGSSAVFLTYCGMLLYVLGQKTFYFALVQSLRGPAVPEASAVSV